MASYDNNHFETAEKRTVSEDEKCKILVVTLSLESTWQKLWQREFSTSIVCADADV